MTFPQALIDTAGDILACLLVFSAGAAFGGWFVQRPARRREREIELADNMRKKGER